MPNAFQRFVASFSQPTGKHRGDGRRKSLGGYQARHGKGKASQNQRASTASRAVRSRYAGAVAPYPARSR